MIEILEHSLGRYEMENEILEAGWDISKNGQEKHIYQTPFLMKELLFKCSKIREGLSSQRGDGTNFPGGPWL